MADAFSKTKAPVAVLEYEPSGFEHVLIKHKSKLILVSVLALAGTVGYWGWRIMSESARKSAAVAFTRAGTVNELKAAAEEHSGKPGAGSALILAAEKLSVERPGEAIGLLKDFLAKSEKHPLRDLASFRIAEYFVASHDPASAEKEYEAVAKAATPFSAFALLRLGDLKLAAGDTEKAREYYDLILKSSSMSGSPARAAAQSRMDRALKIKAPVLVEYKADPAPAATPDAGGLNVQGLSDFGSPGTPGGSPSDSLLPAPKLPPPPAATPPAPSPAGTAPDNSAPSPTTPSPAIQPDGAKPPANAETKPLAPVPTESKEADKQGSPP